MYPDFIYTLPFRENTPNISSERTHPTKSGQVALRLCKTSRLKLSPNLALLRNAGLTQEKDGNSARDIRSPHGNSHHSKRTTKIILAQ